jgi:hypothetical protein
MCNVQRPHGRVQWGEATPVPLGHKVGQKAKTCGFSREIRHWVRPGSNAL